MWELPNLPNANPRSLMQMIDVRGGLRTFAAEEKQAVAPPKANIILVAARHGFAT